LTNLELSETVDTFEKASKDTKSSDGSNCDDFEPT